MRRLLRTPARATPLLILLLAGPAAAALVTGGATESFVQLTTVDIVPTPGAAPAVTASSVMSADSSSSCTATKPSFNNSTFAPSLVASSLPVDANAYPVQLSYFNGSIYTVSPGYIFDYLEVVVLDVSCSVTPAGGSASSFQFQIPIYLCNVPNAFPTQPAFGMSPSDCAISAVPNGCTVPTAGILAEGTYSHSSDSEILHVYQPPSPTTDPEQTPAVAVDLQLFYNGFSGIDRTQVSPFLVRVSCAALSAFTNQ